ncbi:hypothetical protein CDAR_320551 [Caerostris darwini]|uniref:Uncharacterized protein n=1 Tax=Caerostris darwini TaxID=1538125 RepID=A0AAV4X076_9ARAC|nr:hypothetical protein CDAR_320551 [Caerostris darwini]
MAGSPPIECMGYSKQKRSCCILSRFRDRLITALERKRKNGLLEYSVHKSAGTSQKMSQYLAQQLQHKPEIGATWNLGPPPLSDCPDSYANVFDKMLPTLHEGIIYQIFDFK